jgi:hypothetical protein
MPFTKFTTAEYYDVTAERDARLIAEAIHGKDESEEEKRAKLTKILDQTKNF